METRMPRAVTKAQARDIRLSLAGTHEIAAEYRIGINTVLSIRQGKTYGPLKEDEKVFRAERVEREQRDLTPKLKDYRLVVGALFMPGLADQDLQEQRDATHECSHGALGHDQHRVCGCWEPSTLKDDVTSLSLDQRLEALQGANAMRFRKAEFKRSMKTSIDDQDGKRTRLRHAARLMVETPEKLTGMRVHEYLECLPLFGEVRVRTICRRHDLWPLRRIERLTERQRHLIASDLLRMARSGTLRSLELVA